MVVQAFLYGGEVWGCIIPLNTWNALEKIQTMFLRRQLGAKSTTSYWVMLLETSFRSIEILALQRVYGCIKKIKNMSNNRLPHLTWVVG